MKIGNRNDNPGWSRVAAGSRRNRQYPSVSALARRFARRPGKPPTPPLAAADAGADPLLREAIAKLEYLTPLDRGIVLDKGKANVVKLPPERLREIGLLPETWSLEVVPDPASDSQVEQPLSRTMGNALDWKGLMSLAEKHAVRFLHVCTCTNGADPYHMTLWEGVPLREAIWLTRPKANIRLVYYQSYHPENAPPFQSSMALGHILETPPGQMPVILAYKMGSEQEFVEVVD